MKANELIKGNSYIINFDGDNDPSLAYCGIGVFQGELEDIDGLCGLFSIQSRKNVWNNEACYFPLECVEER